MSYDFETVRVEEVSRSFGRRKALSRVTLACRAGEIVGLLGPNGAGKSTLLAILSTLLAPSAGTVRYGDLTADAAGAALRARIGLLGHDLYLYPELSARENLLFFARLYGLPDADALVERALTSALLADRGADLVAGFSRGMRQRLALERATLHAPRLLLLDEPFTGLDDASGHALLARLRALSAAGTILVIATHDLDIADGLLDRAVMLKDGRLTDVVDAGDGSLRDRYRRTIDLTRSDTRAAVRS